MKDTSRYKIIPFSIETTGRLGHTAHQFLSTICGEHLLEARAELIGDLLDIITYNQGRQFVEATLIYNGDIVNPTTEAEPC